MGRARVLDVQCSCGRWVKARDWDAVKRLCPACAAEVAYRLAELAPRWPHVMTACRLTQTHYGTLYTPQILALRSRPHLDVVVVRVVPGQIRDDYAKHAHRFAEAFGVRQVKVKQGPTADVVLLVLHRGDVLAKTVRPLPVAAVPDLMALPLGRKESGGVWSLRLAGHQILVVGATDSGKGSVAWSLIRALAAGITSGTVRVWAFDPKGGMELTLGEPMFDRLYADKIAEMADALDEAVGILQARSQRLRGRTRQHTPTVDEPLYVLLIDELAGLTAYVTDRALKDRIKNALALILTQGRALGVHVVALVQDGRKEILPFRNLFTTRIALRLAEAAEVDLVLDDGMRDRGALCDLIPDTMPGTAYVLTTGRREVERIRFSYLTDPDIRAMVIDYARPASLIGGDPR